MGIYISEFLIVASLIKEVGNSSSLVDKEVLESLHGFKLLLSLEVVLFVFAELGFAPALLDGEGFLVVLKGDLRG